MVRLRGKYLFSPTDEFKDLNLSDFASVVDAFERRINGWFLNPIKHISQDDNNLFVAVAIECLLVDALSGFWLGVKETNGEHFARFLEQRMGFDRQCAEEFYKRFRNGILHQTNIKRKSCISDEVSDLHFENGVLFCNPKGFYEKLKRYFHTYMVGLRSYDPYVQNFGKRFYFLFKDEFAEDKLKHWIYVPGP